MSISTVTELSCVTCVCRSDGTLNDSWKLSHSRTEGVLDCLVQDDNTVKCYHGLCSSANTLQNVYTFDTIIIDSFWCCFDVINGDHDKTTQQQQMNSIDKNCNNAERCLCVREKGLLTFIMSSGQMHCVPLPFMVNGVWPLKHGILIERHVNVYDDLAVLFSLSHPLDDLCPVTCKTKRMSINSGELALSYFTNPSEHVVAMAITHSMSLVIVCNTIDKTHSIFVIKTAQVEDIPSPVSTPGRQHTSLLGTPHPLSSSAPARCMHISPCSPLKFSLNVEPSPKLTNQGSSRRQSLLSPDVLKPRAVQRIKKDTPLMNKRISPKQSSPGILDSGASMKSSGRSPFINRYKTPNTDSQLKWKRAKSLSPQMQHARISPFSQTVELKSWSTFYSDTTISDGFDLMPQLCLHSLWKGQLDSSVTDVFIAIDWTGSQFVVLHLSTLNRLCFLSFNREDEEYTVSEFVTASIEGVTKALYLESMDMILVLTIDGVLSLYNGFIQVCIIDTSSVMGMSLNMGICPAQQNHMITMIRDAIGDGFTVIDNFNTVYRCTIASPLTHPIAKLSLNALCSVFPVSINNLLMTGSYCIFRNKDMGQQWGLFSKWIMASVGMSAKEYDYIRSSNRIQSELRDDLVFNLINNTTSPCDSEWSALSSNYDDKKQIESEYIVPLGSHSLARVLTVLHLVYEELKLNIHYHCYLFDVSILLYSIARSIGWESYVEHYTRDHPLLLKHSMTTADKPDWTRSYSAMNENQSPVYIRNIPPGIYPWIHSVLDSTNNVNCEPFPVLSTVCQRTDKIVKVYSHLSMSGNNSPTNNCLYEIVGGDTFPRVINTGNMEFSLSQAASSSIHESTLNILTNEGLSKSILTSLPIGVAFPIRCMLLQCKIDPLTGWSADLYETIGRNDISQTLHIKKTSSQSLKLEHGKNENDDGMDMDDEIMKLKFPVDARVREVKRLLQSSRPVRIALEQNPETSDHEFIDIQKSYLLNICQRTMALSIGRGMFTMATVHPMLFSPMRIPNLNLSGRAPPKNSTITLERSDYPANMTVWPEFHNGVAAALKIDPGTENIDSTWIIFNHPSDEEGLNAYAGFLMGLGLNGHLSSLNAFYLFEYLQQKHEVTVIGLLIGLAVARCGSMSLSIASVLSVFLPSLLPQGSVDLETSVLMQTAAMMCLGMIYMGSCNRFIAETFLKQIGHSPGPELEFAQNRECYSLTAGLSLGMIALGAGNDSISLSDLYIVDKLCVYMNGGSRQSLLGRDNIGCSYLVQEGDQINTHVTAPGAIVAFGLIYLKTNDSIVASHLTPPTTPYQLDCTRPDFLMLRVVSYSLIMWDSVEPTQHWIDSIIPEIVHKHAFNQIDIKSIEDDSIDYQTMCQSAVYIVAGCCLSLGFRFAGTHQQDVYECLLTKYKEYTARINTAPMIELIGKPCVETFSCALLLALSMVMSGSGDLQVLRLIRHHHVRVHDMNYGRHVAVHMSLGLLFLGGGRFCLSRSNKAIAALLCSVYPHFPSSANDNRYHLQALRHFYMLATEPRVLITRECDTGQSCSVPVDVILEDGQSRSLITPCVIPEWNYLAQIRITNKRYWSLSFDLKEELTRNALMKNGTIFVKRHIGYSSYSTDPQDQLSVLSLAVMSSKQHQFGCVSEKLDSSMIRLFEEEWVEDYYTYLCHSKHKFYSTAFLNCVSKDQMDLLSSYLELYEVINKPNDDCALRLWDIKLCRQFCTFASQQPMFDLVEKSISGFSQYADNIYLKLMMKMKHLPESEKDLRHALMQLQEVPLPVNRNHINATSPLEVESYLKVLCDNNVSPSFAAKTIVELSLSSLTSI